MVEDTNVSPHVFSRGDMRSTADRDLMFFPWSINRHGIAIVGFFIGGFTGHFAYQKYEHSALLVNVFLTIFCAVAHTGKSMLSSLL